MTVQEPVDDRTEQRRAAVVAWNVQAELLAQLTQQESSSRESRMDAQRRLDALRRTQEAMAARAGEPVDPGAGPRAVIVR